MLRIHENDALTGLAGVSALASVGSDVSVYGNEELVDLSGLASLATIGGSLEIVHNHGLQSLGLSALTKVDGQAVTIQWNTALPQCLAWGLYYQLEERPGQQWQVDDSGIFYSPPEGCSPQ
jgi:hypothetical protein